VSLLVVLGIIAVAQAVFVVMLAVFVLLRRERQQRRTARVSAGRNTLTAPLAQWLAGTGTIARVVEALHGLPHASALSFAAELYDTRVPPSLRAPFGVALRDEPWVMWALRGADSWRWWRRLDAARALNLVGTRRDSEALRPLIDDPHPAVRLAAAQALAAVDDPDLVRVAVRRYPQEALALRLFMTNTLRAAWRVTETPLRECLASDAPSVDLAAWLGLAEAMDLPSLRTAITALVRHPDAEVRAPAARALRRYPHAESVEAVHALLSDKQDFVRAAAAQALGVLRAGVAQPDLEHGLTDPAWWVRFRSALALALLGEPGRAALRRALRSPDRYAREIAEMTSGLSDGAVHELADA